MGLSPCRVPAKQDGGGLVPHVQVVREKSGDRRGASLLGEPATRTAPGTMTTCLHPHARAATQAGLQRFVDQMMPYSSLLFTHWPHPVHAGAPAVPPLLPAGKGASVKGIRRNTTGGGDDIFGVECEATMTSCVSVTHYQPPLAMGPCHCAGLHSESAAKLKLHTKTMLSEPSDCTIRAKHAHSSKGT